VAPSPCELPATANRSHPKGSRGVELLHELGSQERKTRRIGGFLTPGSDCTVRGVGTAPAPREGAGQRASAVAMLGRRVAELDAENVALQAERDRLDAEWCDCGRSTCSGEDASSAHPPLLTIASLVGSCGVGGSTWMGVTSGSRAGPGRVTGQVDAGRSPVSPCGRSGHPGGLARLAPPQPLVRRERLECLRRLAAEQALRSAACARLDPPRSAGRGGVHPLQPRHAVHSRAP
jgi:hypothetical protein